MNQALGAFSTQTPNPSIEGMHKRLRLLCIPSCQMLGPMQPAFSSAKKSAFTFYGVWPAGQFGSTGETSEFNGQRFCPRCGSPLFSLDDHEAEIKLGVFSEAPTSLVPSYELWVKRREPWLQPIEGAVQYEENRK